MPFGRPVLFSWRVSRPDNRGRDRGGGERERPRASPREHTLHGHGHQQPTLYTRGRGERSSGESTAGGAGVKRLNPKRVACDTAPRFRVDCLGFRVWGRRHSSTQVELALRERARQCTRSQARAGVEGAHFFARRRAIFSSRVSVSLDAFFLSLLSSSEELHRRAHVLGLRVEGLGRNCTAGHVRTRRELAAAAAASA